MKSKTAAFCLLLPLILACFSCNGKDEDAAGSGQVLARVNDAVITPEDFVISIDLLYPPLQRPAFAAPEGKRVFLQQLIVMELFYQEGVAQGIEQDPKFKQMVKNYKRYLVFSTLMNRRVNTSAIEEFFRQNFVHVAIIFLKKPENADEKQIKRLNVRAQKLRDRTAGGTDFAELAGKNSDHPSAENGGDIGAITRTRQWEPEMIDAAFALTESENLSDVIETPNGFYIVRLIQPVGKTDKELLTPQLMESIYSHLLSQNYALYAAQLQTQASVQINPEVLDGIRLDQLAGPEGTRIQSLAPKGIPGVDPMANP